MLKRFMFLATLLLAALPGVSFADGIGSGTSAIAPTSTFAIAAGVAGNTVVENHPGRIFSVLITTPGTNAFICYDNASAASGTIVVDLPASSVVGIYPINFPLANGLTCAGNVANPAVTIATS